jgi:hypothetical protein
MNQLQLQNSTIDLTNCELDPVSLTIKDGTELNIWQDIGNSLCKIEGSMQFWVGDWVNHGEHSYGEKYTEALKATDYEKDTVEKFAKVCKNIEKRRRRPLLSFSHHAEVAHLEPKQQEKWLNIAEEKHLSIRELRESIRCGKVVSIQEIQNNSGKNSGIMVIQGIVGQARMWKRTVIDANKIDWTPEKIQMLDDEVIKPLRKFLDELETLKSLQNK